MEIGEIILVVNVIITILLVTLNLLLRNVLYVLLEIYKEL